MYLVALVCPHRLFRDGLHEVVRKTPASVLADGKAATEVLERIGGQGAPDLAIFDLDLGPQLNGELAQLRMFRDRFPACRIIVLTDTPAADHAVLALRSGAHALLSRDIPSEVLQNALHCVMVGQLLIPPEVASLLIRRDLAEELRSLEFADAPAGVPDDAEVAAATAFLSDAPVATAQTVVPAAPVAMLSGRENQILQCLIEGFSNKAIARRLDLAEATVKVHLKSLLRKLQAKNRTQAAVWALNNRDGLLRTRVPGRPDLPLAEGNL